MGRFILSLIKAVLLRVIFLSLAEVNFEETDSYDTRIYRYMYIHVLLNSLFNFPGMLLQFLNVFTLNAVKCPNNTTCVRYYTNKTHARVNGMLLLFKYMHVVFYLWPHWDCMKF